MGKEWELDEILERALQEEDPQRMDRVVARLVSEERISRSAMLRRSACSSGCRSLCTRIKRSCSFQACSAPCGTVRIFAVRVVTPNVPVSVGGIVPLVATAP